MSVYWNKYEKVDYYYNIAGCIPGVKEITGSLRALQGCSRLIRGVIYDATHPNTGISINSKLVRVVSDKDPHYSNLKTFLKDNQFFTLQMMDKVHPDLLWDKKYATDKERFEAGERFDEKWDGSLDVVRGLFESKIARSILKQGPLGYYRVSKFRQIPKAIFHPVHLLGSIPFCAAYLAFNTYVPSRPFAPVIFSRLYDNLPAKAEIEPSNKKFKEQTELRFSIYPSVTNLSRSFTFRIET